MQKQSPTYSVTRLKTSEGFEGGPSAIATASTKFCAAIFHPPGPGREVEVWLMEMCNKE